MLFGWFKKKDASETPAQPKANDLPSAVSLHVSGDLESAREAYQHLLEQQPGKAAPAFLLATVLVQLGRLDEAVPLLDDMAQQLGAFASEIKAELAGQDLSPLLEVILAAGDALKRAGRTDLALAWYQAATGLAPDSAEALYRYGDTMHDQRLYNEAERALQRALVIDPRHWGSCYTYGVLLQDLGRDAEAIGYYERAVQLRDDHAKVHNNLGAALLNVGRSADALPHFQRAVQLDPKLAHAHSNLGTVYQLLGLWHHSIAAFDNAISLGAPAGIRVKHALVLPPIAASNEEIEEARNRMQTELAALLESGLSLRDPLREVGVTPFYLAYQGKDDLPLMRQLARLYSAACPQLNYVARHCTRKDGNGVAGRKIRVGFLSTSLYGNTVGRMFHQVIRNLSKERFEAVAISTFAQKDEVTRGILKESAENVTIPMLLTAAQQSVEDAKLDALVYLDLGIEPLSYFLAFARLAPVQIALAGHPVTSGIPNVDFFLSQEGAEPPGGPQHYSERLLALSREVTFTCYDGPAPAVAPKSRADFNLDQASHLYFCPQPLYSVHPDMDRLFAAILGKDPSALLLLLKSDQEEWNSIIQGRLEKAGADLERILFLPRISLEDFQDVLRFADVVLDTLHFCAGTTILDAFAMGAPVVTLPGEFMRGRQTASFYQRMGIDDGIAASAEEYVAKAVRIGTDKEFRSDLSRRILAAAPVLFHDVAMVREFEAMLEQALERSVSSPS